MNDLHLLGAVLLTMFLAALSPGPDFALVMRNALLFERKNGVETALGLACGVAIHTFYCVFLISYLLSSQFIFIVDLVKYLGALYLAWIGFKSLQQALHYKRAYNSGLENVLNIKDMPKSFVLSGFLCNLLNPKAILFFISIFTFLIAQQVTQTIKVFSALGMILITFFWFSLLSWLITHIRFRKLFTGHLFQAWISGVMGVIFLCFAALLLTIHL